MEALTFALALLEAAPALIATAHNVSEEWNALVSAVRSMQTEGRDPTADEWSALHALNEALLARLQG